MWKFAVIALVFCAVSTTSIADGKRTLFGTTVSHEGKSLLINAVDENPLAAAPEPQRFKRDVQDVPFNNKITVKVNHLNDTHKQMMVHWVGEGSDVIICLARDPARIVPGFVQDSPSAVFISYDYGDTYTNKTESFKLPNGSYSVLEKFYNHPKYNTHFVFTDVKNKFIYVTTNHGRDIRRIQVSFTPSEIGFHEYQPSVFAVLDKDDPEKRLWITKNFGRTFSVIQLYVKSFFWLQDDGSNLRLVIQRFETNGLITVAHSLSLSSPDNFSVYDSGVKDFFYTKDNYIFTTKTNPKNGRLELYVSYKLGKKLLCIFDSELDMLGYYVVDVTNNRALIAVSHTDTVSHLYVSENLAGNNGKVMFTLSLESVFCYFPNTTWHQSWLQHVSEDAFADVYKVEGISGIYIASQVTGKPEGHNVQPQHLISLISFDHGSSWRRIKAPVQDEEGQQVSCQIDSGCSLHLSQKFTHYYPDIRAIGILSSKSAPGLIIATGVTGKSLKGHYGVYVSSDAGLTWNQALKELYFFNMGDHGGILTAVKYFHGNTKTRHILYSTDEGEKWSQTEFYNDDIRLYGLMTEPGENTTIFTMFGSAPAAHQWIIVKVDLRGVFSYNCSKDDYKTWSPGQGETRSYIPCVMGQQTTYERRLRHSNCYNGLDYDTPTSVRPCDCDAIDFECDFGFTRIGDPYYCIRNKSIDYDPYEVPKSCKPGQFYNRTKGYRRISGDVCVAGFEKHYLPDVIPCPFDEVQQFLLIAQRDRICRFDLKTKQLTDLPVKDLKNIIAVDFDMKNNCVYWADIDADTIKRQCLGNGSVQEVLVSQEMASVEGLALDWISHTLYFVDGVLAKIELIRVDVNHMGRMRRTILDKLKKPRGIALHPTSGYLFWTDWSVEGSGIYRANLDGSNIKQLFGKKDGVEWPNGITVDHIAERIYWVEAKLDYIASSDLHGNRLNKIITKENVVSHPFAIAVFKDEMYWDDWKNNAVYAADKDHGVAVEILLRNLNGLMDLKVFAHSLQEGTNACSNSSCPYICVGAPKNGHTCLCPDGMDYRNGKCMCPGGVEMLPNSTCPKIGDTCNAGHITCNNGLCIPKGWKCDGEDDCGDNSDEMHCGVHTCGEGYHTCGDGRCIPHFWRCDFEKDCNDGSDEKSCPKQTCTSDQFQCTSGRCISNRWRCDRENDCADGSDEWHCETPEIKDCKAGEFKCTSGAIICIQSTWKCDGENDCRDGSDEINCHNNTCSDSQFSCGPPNNRCIYKTWVCDGDFDCHDHSDEQNCTYTTTKVVPEVVPTIMVQPNGTCHDWMFRCANKKCIPNWWKCDTADDCGDGSDESDCPNSPTPPPNKHPQNYTCGQNEYHCVTGECINEAWVCDGSKDCANGDDELNCNGFTRCTINEFKCRIDGNCIPLKSVCNQIKDCADGSDESSCDHNFPGGPATPSCSVGYFPCDVNSCYPLAALCDNKTNCLDGFDEKNCSKSLRIYQVLNMGVDQRKVNDSSLTLYWWIPTPQNIQLEFLPSIGRMGDDDKWKNESWTKDTEYVFKELTPYTAYNMTVYVRVQNTSEVFPPAKYYSANTIEGIPSAPWNVTAEQKNGSHILLTWNAPLQPNGQIEYYELCWYPPNPQIKLKLGDNRTSHLLTADFDANVVYSFYVIAHNRLYESKASEIRTVLFDGDSTVHDIDGLKVTSSNNNSIALQWNYDNQFDGFKVALVAQGSYPKLPTRIIREKSVVLDDLAPGVKYNISVSAFRKTFEGPETIVVASTSGAPLPTIELNNKDIILLKEVGTSVKLTWAPPKDRKTSWTYGVYYGLTRDELTERSRLNTTDLSATISKLHACEMYAFSVGVIGPYGVGPISKPVFVTTFMNARAPPKNLTVVPDEHDPLVIYVRWSPSCGSAQNVSGYVINVHEKTRDRVTSITKPNCTHLSHKFQIALGGVYEISVSTDVLGAQYARVVYEAPPLLPPYEVNVSPKTNGTYVVTWSDRGHVHGNSTYEVLVSDGLELNQSTAQVFEVEKPPFVYTNSSSDTYTFAVRMKTDLGYRSVVSESLSSRIIERTTAGSMMSNNGLTAVLIAGLVLIVALSVVVGVLVVRHRRLQNSFSRFANSHYDTRSEAATFDDNSLEEDESPHIRGFSDDEPLVIA